MMIQGFRFPTVRMSLGNPDDECQCLPSVESCSFPSQVYSCGRGLQNDRACEQVSCLVDLFRLVWKLRFCHLAAKGLWCHFPFLSPPWATVFLSLRP
jgi:hypothetical protein